MNMVRKCQGHWRHCKTEGELLDWQKTNEEQQINASGSLYRLEW